MGVTWACLKKFGHFPCSSEALIIEVMGVIRISKKRIYKKIVTWWGDSGQVGTCGVRSNPGLGHGEEISVVVKNKFCNGWVFVVYGSDVCISDIQTVQWS